jgi:cytochrome c-type biogenesis protein CcmH/NrfG
LVPRCVWTLRNLGSLCERSGQADRACDIYRILAEVEAENAASWVLLGRASVAAERPRDALWASQRAVDIDSDCEAAWAVMGLSFCDLAREERRPGSSPNQLQFRFVTSVLMGRAKEAFRTCLRLDPGATEIWAALGHACVEAETFAEGIVAFRNAVRHDPEDSEAWKNLGYCFAETRCYAAAARAYKRAIQLNPENAPAWDGLRGLLDGVAV